MILGLSIRQCAEEVEVDPRKRGKGKKYKKKRGISGDQLCIEIGIDRKGNIVMGAVCNGRITTNEIVGFFDGKLGKDVTFVVEVINLI
jgi:hypothetical protein